MDLFLKPVLLGMYFLTVQPNQAHVTDLNGPAVEVQTSAVGLGAHAMLSSRSFLGAGVHYGFEVPLTDQFSIIAQPFGGMSHVFEPVPELPLGTQFEVGLNLLGSYNGFLFGAKYWHASCAGLHDYNPGVDVIGIVFGYQFPDRR